MRLLSIFLLICLQLRFCSSRFFGGGLSLKFYKNNEFIRKGVLPFRGGEKKKSEAKKLVEDNSESEEEDFDEEIDEDFSAQENNKMFSFASDVWVKTPPMTQIYIASSLGLTIFSWLLNKNSWPKILNLDWKAVITQLQFWRPITAFLFFGPFGISYILTIQFVWTYMGQLEKLNYKTPENFLVMIAFGIVTLLSGYTVLGLSPKFLGHNLSTYLVYIWARTFEGVDVNVMDLFVLRAELLPWFFCLQTLLLEGEVPYADILGIVVGHLYYYLTQQKVLTPPKALKDWFSSENMRKKYSRFKDDFE